MADVGLRDLAGVSVGSISSQHTETLIFVSKKGDKRKERTSSSCPLLVIDAGYRLTGANAVTCPLGM